MRYAKIIKRPRLADNAEQIARYLPDNYKIRGETDEFFVIEGEDNAGWTMDAYVLPRLASGLVWGQEIDEDEAAKLVIPDVEYFANRTVFATNPEVTYTPFVAKDGRVGYVVRTSPSANEDAAYYYQRETYIYFNPSDDGPSPHVFVYVGGDNSPAIDTPATFINLTEELR